MKPDVLSLGAFPPGMKAKMAELFTVHHFVPDDPFSPSELAPEARARIRAIATEAHRGASGELIAVLPKLEIICCFGVGTDMIDLAAARERKIIVTNTPGIMVDDVADLAIGLMIASAREILPVDRFAREGRWTGGGSYGFTRKVSGKRLGILGLGAIGSATAARAVGFDMTISYSEIAEKPGVPYRFIKDPVELARNSDFLVVACHGGPSTRHLVSAEVIDALGPHGTLINVARGSIVDEAAMIAALKDGRLGAAALDAFEHEPYIPQELLAMRNVIVQPHMGAASIETREAIGEAVIGNILARFEGRPLRNLV
jgi:lactate dehydrogenase-like 2-hydroxyacid dehydrogenase